MGVWLDVGWRPRAQNSYKHRRGVRKSVARPCAGSSWGLRNPLCCLHAWAWASGVCWRERPSPAEWYSIFAQLSGIPGNFLKISLNNNIFITHPETLTPCQSIEALRPSPDQSFYKWLITQRKHWCLEVCAPQQPTSTLTSYSLFSAKRLHFICAWIHFLPIFLWIFFHL